VFYEYERYVIRKATDSSEEAVRKTVFSLSGGVCHYCLGMREDRTHFFVVHRRLEVMKAPEFIFSDPHALQCELAAETLRSSRTLRLKVAGWSMVPTLWPGDTLVIEPADRGAVRPGDIVLFARHQRFIAHRVVGSASLTLGIQTRGDAMTQMDAPVSTRELLGRVMSIERNGKSIATSREFNASSRAVVAVVRRSPIVARLAVAVREVVQSL
jgi:hypothetical protein